MNHPQPRCCIFLYPIGEEHLNQGESVFLIAQLSDQTPHFETHPLPFNYLVGLPCFDAKNNHKHGT
jgi:hypothetical protein